MDNKLQKQCQFTDSARFMSSSLSNLTSNLAEIELNWDMDAMIKNLKSAKLNTKTVTTFMNIQTIKMI